MQCLLRSMFLNFLIYRMCLDYYIQHMPIYLLQYQSLLCHIPTVFSVPLPIRYSISTRDLEQTEIVFLRRTEVRLNWHSSHNGTVPRTPFSWHEAGPHNVCTHTHTHSKRAGQRQASNAAPRTSHSNVFPITRMITDPSQNGHASPKLLRVHLVSYRAIENWLARRRDKGGRDV